MAKVDEPNAKIIPKYNFNILFFGKMMLSTKACA
jgi:hypothetical protein